MVQICLLLYILFSWVEMSQYVEFHFKLGVRPSLIPLLANYLTDRKMKVKFNGEMSEFLALIGGGPQGTLLGQIEYLVQSNDNADIVSPDDRFKYIDDLSVLQLICLSTSSNMWPRMWA